MGTVYSYLKSRCLTVPSVSVRDDGGPARGCWSIERKEGKEDEGYNGKRMYKD